jgi:hypothetical protein
MSNATRPARPFEVTIWRGDYRHVGSFATFAEALDCYRTVASDTTAQLVNQDRAECGRDGLTDDERDQVAEVSFAAERAARATRVRDMDAFVRTSAALHAHDSKNHDPHGTGRAESSFTIRSLEK